MAPRSGTLAWKTPWMEELGRLQSSVRLFATSLSRSTEGNGNPPQCSCLENPRDRGAWWAAVCGVAQSQTRLKRLNSSSSSVSVSIPVSSSSHPPLPLLCPRVLSLHLHLYFCLGNRFICTAFLDSTCMH